MKRLLTVVYIIAVCILIVTFSISLPIYVRPFYYSQIDSLNLTESSGKTETEIREAYNQVLDYLTLPRQEFGTGVFRHSKAGASHFADCKWLFALNFWLLIISFILTLCLNVLQKLKKVTLCRPFGLHPAVISAFGILGILIPIGIAAAIDFEALFNLFHEVFFTGKENWLFDTFWDPVIEILPLQFFLNCAILITISLVTISLTIIIVSLAKRKSS